MVLIKTIIIIVFLVIFFQDYKNRLVYWFLFPLIAILSATIQFVKMGVISTAVNSLFNLFFIGIIILICYLYSKFKINRNFSEVMGIGDILLFIGISFTFSIVSFLIVFVFSLVFALSLHLVLKNNNSDKTVPLAGYMSMFFGIVYLIDLLFDYPTLYSI